MSIEGVDFSAARPGGAALAAAGKRFVLRYLTNAGAVTTAEIADYHAHGLDVGFIFEGATAGALNGRAQGISDAKAALAALTALGAPTTSVAYFAVDFDASAAQLPAIDDYLAGVVSILGRDRSGVYGGLRVIAHAIAAGIVSHFWQTYAWSGGTWASGIHLAQYLNGQTINGGDVDFDRAVQAQFGQWEAGVAIKTITEKAEDWTPTGTALSNGVFRAAPDATAPIVSRVPLGTVVRSTAEVRTDAAADNDWRVTLVKGATLYMLRRDWSPLVLGGDPAVQASYQAFVDRTPDPAIELARRNGYNAGLLAVQQAANAVKPQ